MFEGVESCSEAAEQASIVPLPHFVHSVGKLRSIQRIVGLYSGWRFGSIRGFKTMPIMFFGAIYFDGVRDLVSALTGQNGTEAKHIRYTYDDENLPQRAQVPNI